MAYGPTESSVRLRRYAETLSGGTVPTLAWAPTAGSEVVIELDSVSQDMSLDTKLFQSLAFQDIDGIQVRRLSGLPTLKRASDLVLRCSESERKGVQECYTSQHMISINNCMRRPDTEMRRGCRDHRFC